MAVLFALLADLAGIIEVFVGVCAALPVALAIAGFLWQRVTKTYAGTRAQAAAELVHLMGQAGVVIGTFVVLEEVRRIESASQLWGVLLALGLGLVAVSVGLLAHEHSPIVERLRRRIAELEQLSLQKIDEIRDRFDNRRTRAALINALGGLMIAHAYMTATTPYHYVCTETDGDSGCIADERRDGADNTAAAAWFALGIACVVSTSLKKRG